MRTGILKLIKPCTREECNGRLILDTTKSDAWKKHGNYCYTCDRCWCQRSILQGTVWERARFPFDELNALVFHYCQLGGKVRFIYIYTYMGHHVRDITFEFR